MRECERFDGGQDANLASLCGQQNEVKRKISRTFAERHGTSLSWHNHRHPGPVAPTLFTTAKAAPGEHARIHAVVIYDLSFCRGAVMQACGATCLHAFQEGNASFSQGPARTSDRPSQNHQLFEPLVANLPPFHGQTHNRSTFAARRSLASRAHGRRLRRRACAEPL